MVKVCAVVVTRDRYSLLKECLSNILTEGAGLISNIVIVDNASSDDTAKLDGTAGSGLTVIHLPNNVGVERGFAVGIEAALRMDVDALLLSDDDTRFLPGSIRSLVDSFLAHGREAIINALPLSHPTGRLSSPRLCAGRFVYDKRELLIANGGRRYIRDNKIHFNGSLIGRHVLERCIFTGEFGEEAYGALIQRAGYSLVIDSEANVLHPSFLEMHELRLLTLPLIGSVVVWRLPPRKAYLAAREAVLKRRISQHFVHFILVDLPIVFGVFLVRLMFEKERTKKFAFYVRGLVDGLRAALRFRRSDTCSGDIKG